jgi:small-conductance mechanosensitive channel
MIRTLQPTTRESPEFASAFAGFKKPSTVFNKPYFRASLLLTSLLTLTACASAPPPSQAMQAAEQAIANAEQERVADYASLELKEAREKLTAAREAVHQQDMTGAKRLAEQAQVQAMLASARAGLAEATETNNDMKSNLESYKQELNRNTGGQ